MSVLASNAAEHNDALPDKGAVLCAPLLYTPLIAEKPPSGDSPREAPELVAMWRMLEATYANEPAATEIKTDLTTPVTAGLQSQPAIDDKADALWTSPDDFKTAPLLPVFDYEPDTPQAPDADPGQMATLMASMVVKLAQAQRAQILPVLANAPWLAGPVALKLTLALNDIDEAAGFTFSQTAKGLGEAELYHLIHAGREGHQVAIARRADLSPILIDTLIGLPPFVVQHQLLRNAHIRFDRRQINGLTDLSRTHSALRQPLIARPELEPEEADLLMGLVGPELKHDLMARFGAPPPASSTAHKAQDRHSQALPAQALLPGARSDTPFLVNLLNRGQAEAFVEGFGRRFGLPSEPLKAALTGPSLVPLALAMAAIGIDKAAFLGVLRNLTREGGDTAGFGRHDVAQIRLARSVFTMSADEALRKLTSNRHFL